MGAKDCLAKYMGLIMSLLATGIIGFLLISDIKMSIEYGLFQSNTIILYFFSVFSAILLVFFIFALISATSTKAFVHITAMVLAILNACGSLLVILGFCFFSNKIIEKYHDNFQDSNKLSSAQNIEKLCQCCGWNSADWDVKSEACSWSTLCEQSIRNIWLSTNHVILEYVLHGVALVLLVFAAWFEVSLTNCERAEYDKLELRPIQTF